MPNKASIRQQRWDKDHTRKYSLKLNLIKDEDIIIRLGSVRSMQGYIKDLIRKDIAETDLPQK